MEAISTLDEENFQEEVVDNIEETLGVNGIMESLDYIEASFNEGSMQAFGKNKTDLIQKISDLRQNQVNLFNQRMKIISLLPDETSLETKSNDPQQIQNVFMQLQTEYDSLSKVVGQISATTRSISEIVERNHIDN